MVDKKKEEGSGDMDEHGDYLEDMAHMENIQETVHAMNPGLSEIYKRFLPTEEPEEEEETAPISDQQADPEETSVQTEKAPAENQQTEETKDPESTEETKPDEEGAEEEKFLSALRGLKGGMEATYNFQNKMRDLLGQDWQPKALAILEEQGTDEDHEAFERVAYQAIPKKEEK
jgi:hypothetical protein